MGFIRAFSLDKERGSGYRFAKYGCRPYESWCKPRPIRVCVVFVVMQKTLFFFSFWFSTRQSKYCIYGRVFRNIYSNFITPWTGSNAAVGVEPEFHLPSCYNVQPPPPGPTRVVAFSDETLFFMFYSSPRDALQEVAAQELYVLS